MRPQARMLVPAIMVLNALFWSWFWTDVWRHTKPYTDHPAKFEEVVPVYKFGAKALPSAEEQDLGSFRLMLLCQRPSFYIAAQTANRLSGGGWDERLGPLSIGVYVLLCTMLVSFAQWGLVALLIDRMLVWTGGMHGRPAHHRHS